VDRGNTITGPGIAVLGVIICVSFIKQAKPLPARLVHDSNIGTWVLAVGFEAFGNKIDADVAT
jgi:hypothetical protein